MKEQDAPKHAPCGRCAECGQFKPVMLFDFKLLCGNCEEAMSTKVETAKAWALFDSRTGRLEPLTCRRDEGLAKNAGRREGMTYGRPIPVVIVPLAEWERVKNGKCAGEVADIALEKRRKEKQEHPPCVCLQRALQDRFIGSLPPAYDGICMHCGGKR